MSWQRQHEPRTFGVYLNNTGYRTGTHSLQYPGYCGFIVLLKEKIKLNPTLQETKGHFQKQTIEEWNIT